MKNIKFLPLVLFGTSLLISCNNSNNKNASAIENVEVSKENAAEQMDTIVGRGCFEIVTEIPYDIPAQRFDETAQALAHASGCIIKTDFSTTGSIQVNAIKGKMSIHDAILVAIEGTDIKITEETDTSLKVELVK